MQILHKVAVIARFLNLTERRVQQLAREGILPKPDKGKYDLVRCVQTYVRYLQERAYGSGVTAQDTHIERARLIKAQADKTELEVATMRNQLVAIDTVETDWLQHISACRMRLLALPTKTAFQIAVMTEPAEIERFLKRAIYEALTELANSHDEPADILPDGTAEGGARVDAAARTDGERMGRRAPQTKPGGKRRTRKMED